MTATPRMNRVRPLHRAGAPAGRCSGFLGGYTTISTFAVDAGTAGDVGPHHSRRYSTSS
jgi:fluoride ion exporter CrcB/FEX